MKHTLNTARPKVGQIIKDVNGQKAVIVKVHPFGTIDVRTESGRFFRITGLSFI